MIHLLGNCQTSFLANALLARGAACEHFWQASPATLLHSPGRVPPELARRLAAPGPASCLHKRELANQFHALPPDRENPDLLVVSLFHEMEPLFAHRDEGWAVALDSAAWNLDPDLGMWMKENFVEMRPNPDGYFQRWSGWLEKLRESRPGVPVLVLTRLGHHPAFGPEPYSYLPVWERSWREAPRALAEWVAGLDGVEMLDVERVLAGVWRRGEQAVEAHCPFLRLTVSGDDEPALAGMRRDLEHVGTLWGPLADKVVRTAESGRVQYSGDESVPVEWSRPFQPEFMTDELRTALLRSGSNYHAARAVGSFFHEPDRDFTDLLAAEGTGVPVCHTTLHMIRAYARLKRNPEIAAWYRAHTRLAEGYAGNGEAFRLRYLRTLEESLAEVRAFAGRDAA